MVVARAPKALSAALTSRFFFSTYPIHLDMAGLIDWSWTARSLRAPKADARRMFLSAVSALAACLRSNDEPSGRHQVEENKYTFAKLQCQPILSNRCVIQVIYSHRYKFCDTS